MKSLLLIVMGMVMSMSLYSQSTSCGDVINDTFDEAGALPTGWTEYSTSGSVTVVNGYLKFTLDKNTPSAYRTFTAVSNDCSCSFDVQGSRTTMNFQMDLVSSEGKYIASIALGKGTTDIKYATAMVNAIPGTYIAGVIGTAKFAKNKNYSLSMYIDFENQTVDFYNAGVLTLENIPFLETTTDFAKVDTKLLYMYANNGTAFVDNLAVVEGSASRIDFVNALAASEKKLSAASDGAYPASALKAFEEAIAAADLVLADCAATTETLVAALEDLQAADTLFETKIALIDVVATSQALLSEAVVGEHYVEYPQAAVDAFEDVISTATTLLAATDVSTENLIVALADLQTAETAFAAAHNDPVALTLFSAYDFTGDEQEYKCGYYNGTLGDFDNKTVAFKLDSGYMVTFAQDVNGLGISKVYIAENKDLAINLPADLQFSVSFVRVSPWYPSEKKGSCGKGADVMDALEVDWYYNWGPTAGNTSSKVGEFVPMSWSGGDKFVSLSAVKTMGENMAFNHHLAFNEPDLEDQSNMTVARALELYPSLLASGLRIGAPAVSNISYSSSKSEFNEGSWIVEFLDSCVARNYRVDFIPVHDYVRRSGAQHVARFKALADKYDLPVWVTEYNYGNANFSPVITDSAAFVHVKDINSKFDAADFIERYSMFYFQISQGQLSIFENRYPVVLNPLGEYTRDHESPSPSYLQEEYEQGPEIVNSIKDVAGVNANVALYPNPVTANIIKLDYTENSFLGAVTVSIFDINGVEVLRQASSPKEINVSQLGNGFYLVNIESSAQKSVQKIIINR